jgi:hypothetical protein
MFLIESLSYSDKSNKYFFTEHLAPGRPDWATVRTPAPVAPASRGGPTLLRVPRPHYVSRALRVPRPHRGAPSTPTRMQGTQHVQRQDLLLQYIDETLATYV